MAKPALGRGLGALLGGSATSGRLPPAALSPVSAGADLPGSSVAPHEQVQLVPLNRVQPCPFQPRKEFSAETLRELADSIQEQGIVQPLIVREKGDHLELIAGERRWRAAQLLNLSQIPVIVRIADDRAVLELALIENLQRENLNALEEAQGYSQLIGQFELTQEQVATQVGRSRAVVANALRLLKLPPTIQDYLRDGRLSVGHAKVILGLNTAALQQRAAERILKEGLNVRQTEGLATQLQSQPAADHPATQLAPKRDTHVTSLEDRLRELFGTKIHLRYARGKGAVEISFYSDAELERIIQILGINPD